MQRFQNGFRERPLRLSRGDDLLTISGESGGMKTAALAALLLVAAPAGAATRTYSVTSFDRIRVDGAYQVSLKTNVAPFARASGSQQALDAVSIRVEGRTLIVRADEAGGWGGYPGQERGPVTIELGTPDLANALVNGAGALNIDKVKGLKFDFSVQGSGMLTISQADVDQMRALLDGSANARLGGHAGMVNASVRGTSTFDAAALAVKDMTIAAEGPTVVRANATNSAKIDARGLTSVAITGGAACTVKTQGSATVTGCR